MKIRVNPTSSVTAQSIWKVNHEISTLIWIAVLIGFFMTSCNPIYYAPNTLNVPLLSEEGETNLSVAGNGKQIELQGAHAINDQFAVLADAVLFFPVEDENGEGGKGNLVEIGAGYLHPFSENWIFEGYGLVGLGSVKNDFPQSSPGPGSITIGDISASMIRWGIQPNFGYKSKYFSAALSARLINLIYHNVRGNLVHDQINQVDLLKDQNSYILVEPALTLRGGLEKIKLQVQLGVSYNITDPSFFQETDQLSIGLIFAF